MRAVLLILAALALVYCSDPTGPIAPVAFGLISGDGQTAEAVQDSLLEPVVGQAYREADGSVAFRALGPRSLHAQTPIGTGVPNVLTCAAPIGENGLEPWQSCRDTDASGFVTYWFDPGTVATDSSCAEIRATVDSTRTVLATVCASVTPGPPVDHNFQLGNDWNSSIANPAEFRQSDVADAYGNAIPWVFATDCGGCATTVGTFDNWDTNIRRSFVPAAIGSGQIHVLTATDTVATGTLEVVEDVGGALLATATFP